MPEKLTAEQIGHLIDIKHSCIHSIEQTLANIVHGRPMGNHDKSPFRYVKMNRIFAWEPQY